jgi:hypothetical protein
MATADIISLQDLFTTTAATVAVAAVGVGLVAGLRSGIVKRVRFAGFELEGRGGIKPEDVAAFKSAIGGREAEEKPFEVVALSNYYNHALGRANVSFWFSIIFGAIGFGVIIFAFATHNKADIWGTVVKAASGTVIDAVSGVFFVQSTNAQKSMADFFEKLRLDRLNAEARHLIGEIENAERRDQLRAQLVLKYAGIDKLLLN